MAKVIFKEGTAAAYKAIASKDASTLYFITDAGLLYKGDVLIAGGVSDVAKSGDSDITLTLSFADGRTPVTISGIASAASVTAVSEALTTHADAKGGSTAGHVTLSDSTSSTSGTSGGVAATPKAVRDALTAAKTYADGILASNDAMVFKGTIGDSTQSPTITTLPTNSSAGWAYKVVSSGTYAGHVCEIGDLIISIKDNASVTASADWVVVQTNLDGAVTGASLAANTVVLGNGGSAVKGLAAGTTGHVLTQTASGPAWQANASTDEKLKTAASTAKMYMVGTTATNGAGTTTGVTNTKVYATNGALTATSFSGSGAGLTGLLSANITDLDTSINTTSTKAPQTKAVESAITAALSWGTI